MLTVFINEGIKMDKCPKNMTLVALNIFGLITILDFFQDTFVSIFKTKRPSDYFAFFSFLLCGGQAYFYIFVFGLLGSTTGRGPHGTLSKRFRKVEIKYICTTTFCQQIIDSIYGLQEVR